MADAPPAGRRLEFAFADGLRALAALTITLLHAYLFTGRSHQVRYGLPRVFRVFELGDFAVPIFIVLSGFVLMLPVARTDAFDFRTGHWAFFRRRARRLLPPYYAAIALYLLLIAAVPLLRHPHGTQWDSKIPVTSDAVLSHLVLVHNFTVWSFKIDGPTWSVATEWQIYLLMPFLLLPLWRGLGPRGAVVVAVFIGAAFHEIWPQYDGAHMWYLGLFAMGMWAAHMAVRGVEIPWLGLMTLVSWVAVVAGMIVWLNRVHDYMYLVEPAVGVAMALLLAWLADRRMRDRPTVLHYILESRLLVWVGLWSYSMYLIHSPLLGLGNLILLHEQMSIGTRFLIEMVVVLPIALLASYIFHRLVERRFMNQHQRAVVSHHLDIAPVSEAPQPVGSD